MHLDWNNVYTLIDTYVYRLILIHWYIFTDTLNKDIYFSKKMELIVSYRRVNHTWLKKDHTADHTDMKDQGLKDHVADHLDM